MNMKESEQEIEKLDIQLKDLDSQVEKLMNKKRRIQSTINKEKSLIFIKENNITKENTQCCDVEDGPYFGHISKFAKWLKKNSNKKWCEWNGSIFLTSDVVNDKYEYTDGRYRYLK